MKKITIVMALVVIFAASAVSAGLVTSDLTETQFDGLVSSNVVAAKLVFRAGGPNSWEIAAVDSDEDNRDDLIWGIGPDYEHPITASFDGAGNFGLEVTPASPGSAVVVLNRTLTWFDTILISLDNNSSDIDNIYLNNIGISIDGGITENIGSLDASVSGSWDAVRIDLGGYTLSNQDSLNILSTLSLTSYQQEYDQFRGEIVFLQTGVVPEPATMLLIITGGLSTIIFRRIRRFNAHGY